MQIVVEQSSSNPLTAVLEIESSREGTPRVEYWREDEDEPEVFWVGDDTFGLEHRLDMLGLRPDSRYAYLVTITDEQGQAWESEPGVVETAEEIPLLHGLLPGPRELYLTTRVVCPRPDLLEAGTTMLTNLQLSRKKADVAAIIWDRNGIPIWLFVPEEQGGGGSGDLAVELVDDHEGAYATNNDRGVLLAGGVPQDAHVLEVGLDHEIRRTGAYQAEVIGDHGHLHHSAHQVDEDRYFTLSTWLDEGTGEASDWLVLHDDRFDPLDNDDPLEGVLWDLVVTDEVPDARYFGNSARYEPELGLVLHHDQAKSALMAFDIETGSLRWVFGPGVDVSPWEQTVVRIHQMVADNDSPWFEGAHDMRVSRHPDDAEGQLRILMHDNGDSISVPLPRGYTRAVEYRIDTVVGTSELLWAYPAEKPSSDADPDQPLAYCDGRFGTARWHGDNVVLFSGDHPDESCGDLPGANVITELRPDYETGTATLVWRMTMEVEGGASADVHPNWYGGTPIYDLRGRTEESGEVLPPEDLDNSVLFEGQPPPEGEPLPE